MTNELKMPTCGTCLFAENVDTGDSEDDVFTRACRFSHAYVTAEDKSRSFVHASDFCADGAWRPSKLGLGDRTATEGAIGYVVARVNVEIALEESEKRIHVVRGELVQ